jgi:mannosyltransferase
MRTSPAGLPGSPGTAPAADGTAPPAGTAPAAGVTAADGTVPADGGTAAAARRRAWLRPGNWLVVVIPAVAELVIGGYRLGGASLWRDEAYTIDAARRTNGQILALLGNVDAVHGPYYLCMHVVVGILGTSAAAIRLPSLLGMSVACGCTAALGRRLARMAALPAPSVTGLTAGLLLAAAPLTTYYAQDARPYGLVTMLAVIATQLLITCLADGRWRWWAAYGAVIALTGMFSLFALLLLFAHGATLLVTRARTRNRARNGDIQGNEHELQARPLRWLAAAAAAIVSVSPLIVLGYRQGQTLAWVTRPGPRTVIAMLAGFAGSRALIPLVAAIAAGGAGIEAGRRHRRGFTVTEVALPWLVLPPLILLAVSLVHAVYVQRYIVFCLPALALLSAAGLAWLARLVAAAGGGRRVPWLGWRPGFAWAPSAVLAAVMAVLLAGPQQAIRLTSARPDNLRAVSAVVSANERPGDAVIYIPSEARVVSMGYPAPFSRLRDIALARSPVASATLTGLQVPAAALPGRFAGVRRVWLVSWSDKPVASQASGATDRAELALVARMRLIRHWTVGSVVLGLYEPRR